MRSKDKTTKKFSTKSFKKINCEFFIKPIEPVNSVFFLVLFCNERKKSITFRKKDSDWFQFGFGFFWILEFHYQEFFWILEFHNRIETGIAFTLQTLRKSNDSEFNGYKQFNINFICQRKMMLVVWLSRYIIWKPAKFPTQKTFERTER